MSTEEYVPAATRLLRYAVASSDMYFSEFEEREVLLGMDERGHLRLWGASSDQPSETISLCRVLLEYALYCSSWCHPDEAAFRLQDLGERLGRSLADHVRTNTAFAAADDPTIAIVEETLKAIGAGFSEEHIERGVRFLISRCPIEAAAHSSGLHDVTLARHGLYALCSALILGLNARAEVKTAPDEVPELMFTVNAPGFA